ncbi:MAG: alkaline phosphatase family protein [Janthinobacterium lividum]
MNAAAVLFAFLSIYRTGIAVNADPPLQSTPSQITLTLLHDNDLHGHLLPFAYTEKAISSAEQPSVGGAARRATLIRQLRTQIKNPVMLIDSGDTFTRGPLCNAYEGIADTEAMNAIGYDLAAIGNNEFKAKDGADQTDAVGSQAALLQVVKRSRFPWVCANAVDGKGAFLEGVQPYVVRDFGGVRIGFLGLTAARSASYPQTKGWTISDPIAAAKQWIPEARRHCDVLIAVTHIGADIDQELAAQTTGLDAIVGGDSHTYLYKALEVVNPAGVKVPIVQDGEFGVRLGRFDLHLARDGAGHWRLASCTDVLLPIGPNIAEAADVQAVLASYVEPFQAVVGHLGSIASTPAGRDRQTTQVVVDALREETGADFAFNPLVGGFFEVFRHPAVTRYDVYAVMPFHNNVVTMTMTGAEVGALLKAQPGTVASGDTNHLNEGKSYRVAFVDYMAHSVYDLPAANLQDTGLDIRDVVIASLGKSKVTAAGHRNVIIFVTDGLRAGSVNQTDSPTLYALEHQGVRFTNSHSLFPTFTTANASAIATGHYFGDTGDFSNSIFTGYPVFNTGNFGKTPGTNMPFIENDQILSDIDDHFSGNYLNEETLLAYARGHGYNTAAVGKQGPTLIQDVTQGNIDHATGAVPPPATIIMDDATGNKGGVPLNAAITAALVRSGVGVQAPNRGNNGISGTNMTPGTLIPNTVQQQYFADAITKAILPTFRSNGRPFALVFWSRDPDGTQHNQGDSLNNLTPGINGPTSKAAIKNVDTDIKQVLVYLKANGLAANTDIFVTADHGFSTISHHEIAASGEATASYASTFTYKDAAGHQQVNTGFVPPGFLAIDLAHDLSLPLYDPDNQIISGKMSLYEPVDPTISQQTAMQRQFPAYGDGVIGGTGAVTTPTDARVVVAANGGSDLIYVPNGTPADRSALAAKIVGFLSRKDYVSGLFADDAFGTIPGALPLSAINLKGTTHLPTPAIVVNFRSFATSSANPAGSGVTFCDGGLQEGQGMHGSFSRADTFNFMAATGPDFKQGYVDAAPVSNADVQVTLARMLGFAIPSKGRLQGRVLRETLLGQPAIPSSAISGGIFQSSPAPNGRRTLLRYQQLGPVHYFDAAGYSGRTLGL